MTRTTILIRAGAILTAVLGAGVAILTSGAAYRGGSASHDEEAAWNA